MLPALSTLLLSLSLISPSTAGPGDPQSPSAQSLYAEGLALWKAGRLAEAQARTAEAVALAPGNLEMQSSLGKLDDLVGRYDEAIPLFRAVAKAKPTDGTAQLDLAIALAQGGSLDESLAIASGLTHTHPNLAPAHRLRAKTLADLHRPDEALAEYKLAERLAPNDWLTQYDMATLLGAMGNTPDQVLHLRRLIALQPGKAQFHFQLGQALEHAGDRPGAITEWREAIRLEPRYREAIYSLSRALRQTDPQEARALEERFREIRQSADVLNSIRDQGNGGVAAMSRRDFTTASALFRSALETCAGCELEGDLEKDLGLALCQAGDLKTGEQMLVAALTLKPADPDIVRALAIARAQLAAQGQKTP